jgi:hypothetical protein
MEADIVEHFEEERFLGKCMRTCRRGWNMPLGIYACGCQDGIETNLREVECVGIDLSQSLLLRVRFILDWAGPDHPVPGGCK